MKNDYNGRNGNGYQPLPLDDLPLLPSTHKEYQNKIKELQAEIEQTYASALRKATGIINKSGLDEEAKKELIYLIWK